MLEEPYRVRALPPGTLRYWSWLFAHREARGPLVGIYALLAEWRALMDPATEIGVAHIKLAWWRDELRRLAAGAPLHPITRYLADLPDSDVTAVMPLERSIDAAAAQISGAPLERSAELELHADSLYGAPLLVTGRLHARGAHRSGDPGSSDAGEAIHHRNRELGACTAALAAGEYLARAIADYRREARAGRVPFVVEELLTAGIDNDDLAADIPAPRLELYLGQLREKAARYFATAAAALPALPAADGPQRRHLAVLATLGRARLRQGRNPTSADFRWTDLYNAWNAARSAAAQ